MSECLNSGQISRITISGYKSIKGPITIEFKKLNVLIGSNGSGKSNFISIFKLLQNVLNQNLGLFANQTGVNAMFHKGRKVTEGIGVEVYFGNNLQFDAGNLAAFLYRLKKYFKNSYDEIIDTIRLIAPYFEDFDLESNDGNGELIVLRWRQKNCDDTFSASQFSDGTLRFICLATLLLQPEELQPETIIIDEPELGLHPYAITIFSELAKQISSKKQIIISTQSVELLNEFDVEDVIVVDRKDEASEFKRLDTDELKDWIDSDYSLGELWNKNIVGGRLSR